MVVARLAFRQRDVAGASGTVDELPGSCADLFPDDLTDRLFAAADDDEGHPDNAAAAIFGGLVASARVDAVLTARLVAVPDAAIPVLMVPDLRLPTSEMRAVLPSRVPMEDAVHNAGRMAAGIAALEAGDSAGFALLADDRLIRKAVSDELAEVAASHGTPRRTVLLEHVPEPVAQDLEVAESDLWPVE